MVSVVIKNEKNGCFAIVVVSYNVGFSSGDKKIAFFFGFLLERCYLCRLKTTPLWHSRTCSSVG